VPTTSSSEEDEDEDEDEDEEEEQRGRRQPVRAGRRSMAGQRRAPAGVEPEEEEDKELEEEKRGLQRLPVRQLRQRALAAGVTAEALDDALDGDDPKGEMVQLVVQAERLPGWGGGGGLSADPEDGDGGALPFVSGRRREAAVIAPPVREVEENLSTEAASPQLRPGVGASWEDRGAVSAIAGRGGAHEQEEQGEAAEAAAAALARYTACTDAQLRKTCLASWLDDSGPRAELLARLMEYDGHELPPSPSTSPEVAGDPSSAAAARDPSPATATAPQAAPLPEGGGATVADRQTLAPPPPPRHDDGLPGSAPPPAPWPVFTVHEPVVYRSGDGALVPATVALYSTNVPASEEPLIAVRLPDGTVRDTVVARLSRRADSAAATTAAAAAAAAAASESGASPAAGLTASSSSSSSSGGSSEESESDTAAGMARLARLQRRCELMGTKKLRRALKQEVGAAAAAAARVLVGLDLAAAPHLVLCVRLGLCRGFGHLIMCVAAAVTGNQRPRGETGARAAAGEATG
jgi:hypothetical protein